MKFAFSVDGCSSRLAPDDLRPVPVENGTSELDVAAANAHVEWRAKNVRRGRHFFANKRASESTLKGTPHLPVL